MKKGRFLANRGIQNFEEVQGYHFFIPPKYNMFVYKYGSHWSANEVSTGWGAVSFCYPRTRNEAIRQATRNMTRLCVAEVDSIIETAIAFSGRAPYDCTYCENFKLKGARR